MQIHPTLISFLVCATLSAATPVQSQTSLGYSENTLNHFSSENDKNTDKSNNANNSYENDNNVPASNKAQSGISSVNRLPLFSQQNVNDDVLLEMNQAFRKGNKSKLPQLLLQAKGHPLEPWAAYWELKSRLNEASESEVQNFLQRYAGSYQEDRLRNDWLLLLGQRRNWSFFTAHYAHYRMRDDKEVQCYALYSNLLNNSNAQSGFNQANSNQSDTLKIANEVRQLWYNQRETDDGCALAAINLYNARQLSETDLWKKARLGIENNRLKMARQAIENIDSTSIGSLQDLNESPVRFLAKRSVSGAKTRSDLITLALIKQATSNPDSAADALDKWNSSLTSEERNWVWAVIGKQAALRLQSNAAHYFAQITQDSDLNDDLLGWKVRAALKASRWSDVLSATQAMSAEAKKDSTWMYWRGKASLTLGRTEAERMEALQLFLSLASSNGFYEQLAAEELGRAIVPPQSPDALTAAEKQAVRQNAGLNRGLYAISIGLRSEGTREWNYHTNLHQSGGLNDRELLAAADLACQYEVWDRCINTSERTKQIADFSQRYPMPFHDAVLQRSRAINLDPAYVYGLIRQESRFIMDARSNVGASGLMQVMPATARWTAKKIGLDGFSVSQLNHRDTNIAIGTAYLKLALDDFGGSMPMAAAAYNAGPGRPRSWRNAPSLDTAIWIENIPFTETRDYVKKVLSNTTVYASIITKQPQSLRSRLGQITSRSTNEANLDLP